MISAKIQALNYYSYRQNHGYKKFAYPKTEPLVYFIAYFKKKRQFDIYINVPLNFFFKLKKVNKII